MVPQAYDVANTLTHRMHKGINTTVDEGQTPILSLEVAHALRAEGFDASEDGSGRGTPIVPEVSHPLMAGQNETGGNRYPGMTADSAAGQLIAFDCKASGHRGFGAGEVSPTLRAMGADQGNQNSGGQVATTDGASVRRLTPRECERLQGMPDDYTLVPYRGKPAADGPRYKSLGNSMAVTVIRWIGRRIEAVLA